MASSPLFRLPRELRDSIYRDYVIMDGGYVCATDGYRSGKLKGASQERIDLSLVCTCKRIAGEMQRGGLALQVNHLTFSTLESENLSDVACHFQEVKSYGIDLVRCEMFQTYGHRISERVCAKLRESPQFMPLLDRMKAEGRPTPVRTDTLSLERHGPYSEAPSVYRAFIEDALKAAWADDDGFRKLVAGFVYPLSTRKDIEKWSPFEIINDDTEPWVIPTEGQINTLISVVPSQHSQPRRKRDRSKYRFSAAAAVIYFLTIAQHPLRQHLRKIILNEDFESVLYAQEHAKGLIPFCKKYPLKIERRVSLWKTVFQEDMFYMDPADRCWLNRYLPRRTPCFLNSDQISGNVASWVIEALALVQAGMPSGSFSLVLDGGPCLQLCSRIFQSVVQRDAGWQEAWIESLERGILRKVTWFERRGDSVLRHGWSDLKEKERVLNRSVPADRPGYWGYIFERFPQALRDMTNGTSIVSCNFDIGVPEDVETIVQQHQRWNSQQWETEWFNHSPAFWETDPPLPEWRSLLEDNLWNED